MSMHRRFSKIGNSIEECDGWKRKYLTGLLPKAETTEEQDKSKFGFKRTGNLAVTIQMLSWSFFILLVGLVSAKNSSTTSSNGDHESSGSKTTVHANRLRRGRGGERIRMLTSVHGDQKFIEKLQTFRLEMFPEGPASDRRLRDVQGSSSSKDATYLTNRLTAYWLPLECKVLPLELTKVSTIHKGKRNEVIRMADPHNRQYAYKTFENPDEYTMELQFFIFSKHEYIVRPVCIMKGSGGRGGIVFEYVEGSSSIDYASHRDTSQADLKRISAQLLSALEYIHWLGFVHADLKPENVMVDKHGNIRVIDFGFAIPLPYGKANRGTPTTIAPELVDAVDGSIHEGIDWWAYGSTVAIWYGLYHKIGRTRKFVPLRVMRGEGMKFGKVPHQFPIETRELVYLCLTPNPEKRRFNSRAQLKFLRDLPFFDEIDWSKIYHH